MAEEKIGAKFGFTDALKESYAATIETATRIQDYYNGSAKRFMDNTVSMQKSWMDSISKSMERTSGSLGLTVGTGTYKDEDVYEYLLRQFGAFNNIVGVPSIKELLEANKDLANRAAKVLETSKHVFLLSVDMTARSSEVINDTLADWQRAALNAYKGSVSIISLPDDTAEKTISRYLESLKQGLDDATSLMRKEVEASAKLIEEFSARIAKLSEELKAGN